MRVLDRLGCDGVHVWDVSKQTYCSISPRAMTFCRDILRHVYQFGRRRRRRRRPCNALIYVSGESECHSNGVVENRRHRRNSTSIHPSDKGRGIIIQPSFAA